MVWGWDGVEQWKGSRLGGRLRMQRAFGGIAGSRSRRSGRGSEPGLPRHSDCGRELHSKGTRPPEGRCAKVKERGLWAGSSRRTALPCRSRAARCGRRWAPRRCSRHPWIVICSGEARKLRSVAAAV